MGMMIKTDTVEVEVLLLIGYRGYTNSKVSTTDSNMYNIGIGYFIRVNQLQLEQTILCGISISGDGFNHRIRKCGSIVIVHTDVGSKSTIKVKFDDYKKSNYTTDAR